MRDLDEALNLAEEEAREGSVISTGEAYEIVVKNSHNGSQKTVPVYPENVTGQIFDMYQDALGLNNNTNKIFYVNTRTHKSTPDPNMTMEEFDLREGDTLEILTDGVVAAK